MKNTQKKELMSESQWYTACWNYFALLSGQRMQMLHFFITIEVFLSGAFITLISLGTRLAWAEIVISTLVFLIAIVFMGLDYRTKNMIHECERSMMAIENADTSLSRFNPIASVNSNTKSFFTYSKLIRILQIAFALAGAAGAILVYFGIV